MNVLVDTNVILDAMTSREPWNKAAEKILIMAANKHIYVNISASAVTDIYYILRKNLHSAENAKKVLQSLFSLVHILNVTSTDCIEAFASEISDYEDAVIESVAKRNELDCIVTRNRKDFEKSKVKIMSPDELVRVMENEKSL